MQIYNNNIKITTTGKKILHSKASFIQIQGMHAMYLQYALPIKKSQCIGLLATKIIVSC